MKSSWLERVIFALTLCITSAALAHALGTNTARMTLRDAHVEVSMQLDLLGFLAHLDEEQTRSGHDGVQTEPTKASQLLLKGRKVLEAEAAVLVDGRRVPLTLREFPDVNQLAQLLMAHHGSRAASTPPMLVPIVLETKLPSPAPALLSLELPHELEPVLVTFVQPQTQLSSQHQRATFSVLRRAAKTAGRYNWQLMAASAGAVLAVVLLFSLAARRRTGFQSSDTASVV